MMDEKDHPEDAAVAVNLHTSEAGWTTLVASRFHVPALLQAPNFFTCQRGCGVWLARRSSSRLDALNVDHVSLTRKRTPFPVPKLVSSKMRVFFGADGCYLSPRVAVSFRSGQASTAGLRVTVQRNVVELHVGSATLLVDKACLQGEPEFGFQFDHHDERVGCVVFLSQSRLLAADFDVEDVD